MCKQTINHERQCVICNRQLHGRSDKRFCDIACKNKYHCEVRKSMRNVQTETLRIITKNFVILSGIMGPENDVGVVDKLALERLGFRFDYVTGAENRHGIIHYNVFGMSYRFIHHKRVMITVDRDRTTIYPFIFRRWQHEIAETIKALND